jgi:predicted transport protein
MHRRGTGAATDRRSNPGTYLGDDVDEKQLKLHVAFRRIKNFACVAASAPRVTPN